MRLLHLCLFVCCCLLYASLSVCGDVTVAPILSTALTHAHHLSTHEKRELLLQGVISQDGLLNPTISNYTKYQQQEQKNKNNQTAVFAPQDGYFGLDVSTLVGSDSFRCLKRNGYSYVIVRAWQSLCRCDPHSAETVNNAWAGGMTHVDVYFFPARACGTSPESQVDQTLSCLQAAGAHFGTFWFDIETHGSDWSSDPTVNAQWLHRAVKQAQYQLGGRVGIYSNKYNWASVMGNTNDLAYLPMWYAHYDARPSFSDWSPFGGWKSPAMKQFNDKPQKCGVSMDHNWYP